MKQTSPQAWERKVLCFDQWSGCAINDGREAGDEPARLRFRIIRESGRLAREASCGGRRRRCGSGAGHELLPALLGASCGEKLQADLYRLRLLYVLLGFLLRRARPTETREAVDSRQEFHIELNDFQEA